MRKIHNEKMASILGYKLCLLLLVNVFATVKENPIQTFEQKPIQILEGHNELVNSVAFSSDGFHIASGSADSTIIIWELKNKKKPLVNILKVQDSDKSKKNRILSVAFSPLHKNLLASGSWDTNVYFWNVSSVPTPGKRWRKGHSNYVRSVSFSPDGDYLASGSYDNTIKIWDTDQDGSKKAIRTLGNGKAAILCVLYSPKGDYIASGSDDHIIRLWNPKFDGRAPPMWSLIGHTASVLSIDYSPDGFYLASGSEDNTIKVWSADFASPETDIASSSLLLQTPELVPHNCDSSTKLCTALQTLTGHNGYVMSVAFSPDGAYLASGSYDKTIKIWSLANFKCLVTLKGHTGSVRSIAYSPDGQLIVSGSGDKKVMIWKNPFPPTTITTITTTKTTTTTTTAPLSRSLTPSLLQTEIVKVQHQEKKMIPFQQKTISLDPSSISSKHPNSSFLDSSSESSSSSSFPKSSAQHPLPAQLQTLVKQIPHQKLHLAQSILSPL